jgi:uncharacterized membrane protein
MRTSRLEAFSDGVLAIVITVMVLRLHVPEGADWSALGGTATGFLTYALSFVYVGTFWSNHHHMFQVVESVRGGVLWANLHLLFWLSLLPFTTAWMDESGFERVPTVVYGFDLLMGGVAYHVVQLMLFRYPGGERLREALGSDLKGKSTPVIYLIGIGLCFVDPLLGLAVYTVVALMWLVPDRRVERFLAAREAAAT